MSTVWIMRENSELFDCTYNVLMPNTCIRFAYQTTRFFRTENLPIECGAGVTLCCIIYRYKYLISGRDI